MPKTRAEALAGSPEVSEALARGKREAGKAASLARARLGKLVSSLLDEDSDS